MIRVLVPVLDRPQNAKPLLDSLAASDPGVPVQLTFVASPEDLREHTELNRIGANWISVPHHAGPGDWARKINFATNLYKDEAEWFLLGADDIRFHPGWAEHALACAEATGALVIGTKDLCNQAAMKHRNFSTHPLVHSSYVDRGVIDQPGILLNDSYDHNFPDRELAETAHMRKLWTYCEDSIVEHLHPMRGISEKDATYEKGFRRFHQDHRLFIKRRRLWRYQTGHVRRRVRAR